MRLFWWFSSFVVWYPLTTFVKETGYCWSSFAIFLCLYGIMPTLKLKSFHGCATAFVRVDKRSKTEYKYQKVTFSLNNAVVIVFGCKESKQRLRVEYNRITIKRFTFFATLQKVNRNIGKQVLLCAKNQN